ncbi:hypothetical protein BJX76DRAFT_369279 [Aspergillus varians]
MESSYEKIYQDITRLHEQEENILSVTAARGLGIKIRRVEQPTSSRPVPFKPCFFLPPKGDKTRSSLRFAKRASCVAASSPSSSTSTLPYPRPSFHSSASSSLRRSSSSCLPSSSADESQLENGGHDVAYPSMVQSLAETKRLLLPRLPRTARRAALTANGPVMKGKCRQDETVELHEDNTWKITQVLEDTKYNNPHAIIEIMVNSHTPTDEFFLTVSEVKALLRLLKLRMGMSQYQHHACLPVLALSYITTRDEKDTEYQSGRIVQAHHDGCQLVIQYSQRLEFSNVQMAPASLDKFLRYYFSEPVKTGVTGGEKNEDDPSRMLQSWNTLKKRCRINWSVAEEDTRISEGKEDRPFRHWLNKVLEFM